MSLQKILFYISTLVFTLVLKISLTLSLWTFWSVKASA